MGLNQFYASGMIGIYFWIEECFPERGDIHKKLVQCQIPQTPFAKGGDHSLVLKLKFDIHLAFACR